MPRKAGGSPRRSWARDATEPPEPTGDHVFSRLGNGSTADANSARGAADGVSPELGQALAADADPRALPFSVRVSLDRSLCQIRATALVTRAAMYELGSLTRYRELTAVKTLAAADTAINAALDEGFNNQAVSRHLSEMRETYLGSLSELNRSAMRTITALAFRKPNQLIWIVTSVRRVLSGEDRLLRQGIGLSAADDDEDAPSAESEYGQGEQHEGDVDPLVTPPPS